jgi:hypothetical protein
MGNFEKKIATFIRIFIEQDGYALALEGLKNTLISQLYSCLVYYLLET